MSGCWVLAPTGYNIKYDKMVLQTHHNTLLKKNLRCVLFWDIMQRIMKIKLYVSVSALHDDTQHSL